MDVEYAGLFDANVRLITCLLFSLYISGYKLCTFHIRT